MAVVTEAFDIPLDIMTKLATGEYRRILICRRDRPWTGIPSI